MAKNQYAGKGVDTCEMAKICGKCLICLTNGLNKLEMTWLFGKWQRCF